MLVEKAMIREFRAQRKVRDDVARILESAGFEVSLVVDEPVRKNPAIWGYYLKLSPQLQSLFGTGREVLVWAAEPQPLLATTVMEALGHIEAARPRLCEDFAFIVSTDPETARKVEETTQTLPTAFVGLSSEHLRELERRGKGSLVRYIQTQLFTRDLYYISTAIRDPLAFFGRRDLVHEIHSDLTTGTAHVGLFGLRKMGKTSLLLRLVDQIRSLTDHIWSHVDIQRIDAVRPSTEFLLWSIGERLFDANPTVRKTGGLRMFGRRTSFRQIPDPESVVEDFDHDLRMLLRHTGDTRVVLMFDEVELMTQPRWADSFVRVWRLLRALDQEFAGRLSYFITGTNPHCIEVNRLHEEENPAYNYFKVRFLAPLREEDSRDLLVKLGRPMGLIWQDPALERVHQLVGGHPFLLRSFGSLLHRIQSRRTSEIAITTEQVQDAVEDCLREMTSTLSQMIEVIEEEYPDEYELLSSLARGRVGEFRQLAEAFPTDVAHLVGYGLVRKPATATSLSVEILQTWLQQRARVRDSELTHSRDPLEAGDTLEGYVVEASMGHVGGMGRVYKCWKSSVGDGDPVALKVLLEGTLPALEREVVALRALRHANVVRFIDYGKTVDGKYYIVMEYLNGRSLRYFCQRATKLDAATGLAFLTDLADALASIHPNGERVEALRGRGKPSEEELRELQEARQGYVHRDIKPENVIVVEGRGPVLIDFGLSCRVGTPVMTFSGTQGYFPPDGIAGVWDQDTDLFQLGVTMLQAMVGSDYDGRNLADLRQLAMETLEPSSAGALLRLTDSLRPDRYESAGELLESLRSNRPTAP